MPPAVHVTLRKRESGLYATCVSEMKLLGEFAVEGINVLIAVAQILACVGFYPEYEEFYKPACVIFLVTSVMSVVVLGHAIHEAHEHAALSDEEEGKHQREVAELILFLLASIMFAVGSVLFLPEVAHGRHERSDIHAGTWCFLIGSAQLALAFFVNSLSVAEVGTWSHQSLKNKLAIVSLLLGQVGSVLFLIGTPLYFPQLAAESCNSQWNMIRFGTNMYISGAISYLLGALVNTYLAYLKHAEHEKHTSRARLRHGLTTGFGSVRAASLLLHRDHDEP